MNFEPTMEQTLYRDSLGRYLADVGEPGRPPKSDLRAGLAELGILALPFPEDLGGLGGTAIDTMFVAYEIGRALAVTPWVASTVLAGTVLRRVDPNGAPLAGLIDGTRLIVGAFAEAASRGRIDHVETTATRSGDGFLLQGTKSVVIGADEADGILVSARSADGAFPGIGLFLVRAEGSFVAGPYRTIDGHGAADLVFTGHRVPAEALLAGDCGEAIGEAVDAAIMAVCAEAVGAMEAVLWTTVDYLKLRRQFGVAIGTFQAIQHRMADLYVDLEQARSMLYRGTAALVGPERARSTAVSAAKALIGRVGKHLGAEAVQLHGGIGVSQEHAVGRYFKRLVVIERQFGDSDFHLARFAAG